MKLFLASFAVIASHADLFSESPEECKQLWKRVHKKKCLTDQDECRKFSKGNKASERFEKMAKNFCKSYKKGGNLYAGYQFFLKGETEFCEDYMNDDENGSCIQQKHIESRFLKKAFTMSENKKCSKFLVAEICEKDIDDCEGHACENGGRCVDGIGGYSCFCRRGYEGKRCEISHSDPSESSESSEPVDLCADYIAPRRDCTADLIASQTLGCWCDPATGPPEDPCDEWTLPPQCTQDEIDLGESGPQGCYCNPDVGPQTHMTDCGMDWMGPIDSCTATDIDNCTPGCCCENIYYHNNGPVDLCADYTAPRRDCTADLIANEALGCYCDPATGPPEDPCDEWTLPPQCTQDEIDLGESGPQGCYCNSRVGPQTHMTDCGMDWMGPIDSCTPTDINNCTPGCCCENIYYH